MSSQTSGSAEDAPRRGPSVRDQLQVLRRRKWILLQALIIVPALAVALSSREAARYEADSQVLLTSPVARGPRDEHARSHCQWGSSSQCIDASQACASARCLDRTLASAPGTGVTRDELEQSSSVGAATDADILTFVVTAATPELAKRLATAYAQAYTAYRHQIDTAALQRRK